MLPLQRSLVYLSNLLRSKRFPAAALLLAPLIACDPAVPSGVRCPGPDCHRTPIERAVDFERCNLLLIRVWSSPLSGVPLYQEFVVQRADVGRDAPAILSFWSIKDTTSRLEVINYHGRCSPDDLEPGTPLPGSLPRIP